LGESGGHDRRTDRQRLAAELRRLRQRAGVSGRQLARRIGISQSTVSRIESGTATLPLPEVTAWAEAVGASAEDRTRLTALAEAVFATVQPWRSALAGRAHLQDEIEQLESWSRAISVFQPSVVPGLLQTAEYSRRVFALFQVPYSDDDLAKALAGRLNRQVALYEEQRSFSFLITEAALRWCPGPPRLLAAQLDRIASLSTLENVSVGLIRQGGEALVVIPEGFDILSGDRRSADTVVTVETVHANLLVTDPSDVALYQQRWAQLARMAIFEDEARSYLARLRVDLRSAGDESQCRS
jgi:transcriptional regulator with XRE-family HTH domain